MGVTFIEKVCLRIVRKDWKPGLSPWWAIKYELRIVHQKRAAINNLQHAEPATNPVIYHRYVPLCFCTVPNLWTLNWSFMCLHVDSPKQSIARKVSKQFLRSSASCCSAWASFGLMVLLVVTFLIHACDMTYGSPKRRSKVSLALLYPSLVWGQLCITALARPSQYWISRVSLDPPSSIAFSTFSSHDRIK